MTRTWRSHIFIATSLDGYIAREDGDIAWLTDPPAHVSHAIGETRDDVGDYSAFMARVDHVAMGRSTYELAVGFDTWPFSQHEVVVLSTTLAADVDARVTVARSIEECCGILDERGARGVYVDGGQVIRAFLQADLIDEITITHAPVLLGGGRPLFGYLSRDVRLSLRATGASAPGLVHANYIVDRTEPAEFPEGRGR